MQKTSFFSISAVMILFGFSSIGAQVVTTSASACLFYIRAYNKFNFGAHNLHGFDILFSLLRHRIIEFNGLHFGKDLFKRP